MNRWIRYGVLLGVIALHLLVLLTVTITTRVRQQREDTTIFKMVDVTEIEPAEPEDEPAPPPRVESPIVTTAGPAEIVLESEEALSESDTGDSGEVDYLPQHRISKAPEIPTDQVQAAIEYPPLANRQGIEGVVYLELYVDAEGTIQKIEILREPGFGLGEAAVRAFEGIVCKPAEANGVPVPVRYRFPIRFILR